MSRPLDGESRAATLIDAINHILVTEGIRAVTIRRIAEVSGVSTGAVMNHFGNRERLLRLAASKTVIERLRTVSLRFDGLHAFLPRHEQELQDVRAYLAWLEVERAGGDPDTGFWRRVTQLRRLLRVAAQPAADPAWVDTTEALIHGLLHALCRPAEPLTVERAHQLLAGYLAATGQPRA